MTIEEYYKQKNDILADVRSKKITPEQGAEKFILLIPQHPEGKGLADYTAFIQMHPGTANWSAQQMQLAEQGKLKGKLANGLMVLSDLGMTAASLNQIAVATQAARGLHRPDLPAVPGYNPQLTQALYEAQRGVVNPNAVLDPAKQQIQQGYLASQQANQIASGGQAGMLAPLTQVANLQRMQASLGLAPLSQSVLTQNAQNRNQLLGMRLGETQNMFGNQMAATQLANDQYRFGAQAAGLAGSSGRQNLLDAAQRLAYHLGNSSFDGQPMAPTNPTEYVPTRASVNRHAQPFAYPMMVGRGADMVARTAPAWIRDPGLDPANNEWIRRAFAERTLHDVYRRQNPYSLH